MTKRPANTRLTRLRDMPGVRDYLAEAPDRFDTGRRADIKNIRHTIRVIGAKPLAELTRRQRLLSWVGGARVIEHITQEQIRQGVEEDLAKIKGIFDKYQGSGHGQVFCTNELKINTKPFMKPQSVSIELQDADGEGRPYPKIVLWRPEEGNAPSGMIDGSAGQAFELRKEGITADTWPSAYSSFDPFNENYAPDLAYLSVTAAAAAMEQADQTGTLVITNQLESPPTDLAPIIKG